ncbi:hypothetical protein [Streptomyces sp. NPDC059957]|uniref:hypothetical protein n=1 Tax=Streptomyces sp. NPDC059957 TaxID=3347016 RepID=UPI00364DB2F7
MHSNDRPSDVVGAQIRRHRGRLALSREQLADRCAELGAPELTYSAIVDIEGGRRTKEGRRRRSVSLDEWLVLGLALGVPPLLLACPLDTAQPVPVTPGTDPQAPYTLWRWITGQEAPALGKTAGGHAHVDTRPIGENGPRWATAWATAAYPASLYPEAERRVAAAEAAQRHAADPAGRREYVERLGDLAELVNELIRAGLPVPPIPPSHARELDELGLLDRPPTPNHEETSS